MSDIPKAFPESQSESEPKRLEKSIAPKKARHQGIVLTRLVDLLAEPPEETPWLVEGLLPQGGVSVLAGKPKAGKSTLARCIALAVASGATILNRKTSRGPVIYIGLEDRRRTIADHFRRMGAKSESILVHTGNVTTSAEESVELLRQQIDDNDVVLLVVDTMLRLIRVSDTNDYAEMTASLSPWLSLARESRCHVMLVHHAGKKDRDDLDSILGSTAIAGTVDTGLIVRRRGSNRTLSTTQREGDDFPEALLMLDPETGRIDAGGNFENLRQDKTQSTILEHLRHNPGQTESQVREAIGGDGGLVGCALRELHRAGKVNREVHATKGKPFHYSVVEELDESKVKSTDPRSE